MGVEAAHRTELFAETVGKKELRSAKRRIRTRPARAVRRAESRFVKSATDYHFRQAVLEHPELERNNVLSLLWQKQRQRREYVKRMREAAGKTAGTAKTLTSRAAELTREHPGAIALAVICALLLILMQSGTASLSLVGGGVSGSVAASTYPAEDADLVEAEDAYAGLETELQNRLDSYESTHSYDEYHFNLDEITHDPYVLLSILSALHPEGWTLTDVQSELQTLFDRQYIFTEDVTVEIRYRTETVTDDEGNEYEIEVPYRYYICAVTLENFNLSHLPVYIMGEEALSRYALYMATLGNRPDLFPSSAYVEKYSRPVPRYEMPPEVLADETFATMIAEAERYLGFPYVWGGSSPATFFDCSGFVSWVINHSGWDVGQLGATGLYNICTPVSDAEARPGDLVFFQGTYDTAGMSHVGIYVGDGVMLRCGDPIQYTSIRTSYWQSHFAAFGRLP